VAELVPIARHAVTGGVNACCEEGKDERDCTRVLGHVDGVLNRCAACPNGRRPRACFGV